MSQLMDDTQQQQQPQKKQQHGYPYQSKNIFIGNIDWNVSPKVIYQTMLAIFNTTDDDSTAKLRFDSNLTKEQIHIKSKTTKKRDVNKLHGGSLILSFHSDHDALVAMDILLSLLKQHQEKRMNGDSNSDGSIESDNYCSILNSKSNVHIRWGLASNEPLRSSHEIEKNDQDDSSHDTLDPKEDQQQQLLEHRKQRSLKYQRQRQRIAQQTDDMIELIRPNFIPNIIETLNILTPLSSTNTPISSTSTFSTSSSSLSSSTINWSTVPYQIDPIRGGKLKTHSSRGYRKQAQVEAFVHVLTHAFLNIDGGNFDENTGDDENKESNKTKIKIADLGCGAGNLSIPLAWLLRQKGFGNVKVVAVDINKRALDQLDRRAKEVGLDVEIMEEDLLNLISDNTDYQNKEEMKGRSSQELSLSSTTASLESCSAVVSLHACGAASDLAINAAVSHSLPFAISPCCIGKVKSVRSADRLPSLAAERGGRPDGTISYPRSKELLSILKGKSAQHANDFDINDYSLILSAADYSMGRGIKDDDLSELSSDHSNPNVHVLSVLSDQERAHYRRGRMAKLIVETDRLKWAEERGYYVRMMELPRIGAMYPKRELLLGAKRGSSAAHRISCLPHISSTQLSAKLRHDYEENNPDIDSADNELETSKGMKIDGQNMDLNGFTNYLIPYAIALIGSLAVTAIFFKFVLMDY